MKLRTYLHLPLLFLFFAMMLAILLVPAFQVSSEDGPGANTTELELEILVNMTSVSSGEGDHFTFTTTITNNGTEATPQLVAHLNVASLQKGIYVDPEDWSEVRTIFVNPIGPGASLKLSWKVHTLFAGNFAVYVVVLAKDSSSLPVVSDEIHVHVEKWTFMQLEDVTPVIVAIPVVLGVLCAVQKRHLLSYRRNADGSGSHPGNDSHPRHRSK